MERRLLILILSVTALGLSLVFGVGFFQALQIGSNTSKREQMVREAGSAVATDERSGTVIVTLGDSIGAGVGDEAGLGIDERYLSLLDQAERSALSSENFAVSGAETSDMRTTLQSGAVDLALKDAAFILISIGGNNLNRINETSAALEMAAYDEALKAHRENLAASLTYIRERNPLAHILVLGLYNPYGNRRDDQALRLLHRWNYETRETVTAFEGTNMVPLYDIYEGHLDRLLSIDRFHPSGEGYQVIAEGIDGILGR